MNDFKVTSKQFLLALFFLGFCWQLNAAQAPKVTGQTLSGKSFDYSVEKPTLYIFWASWCSRCRAEMPELVELYQELSPQIVFIGINVDTQSEKGLRVQSKYKLPYPSVADPTLKISEGFSVFGTPTLVLSDAQGKEIDRANGLSQSLKQRLLSLR